MSNNMPDVKGMGLKDALFLLGKQECESAGKGKRKSGCTVVNAGTPLSKGQIVVVELN